MTPPGERWVYTDSAAVARATVAGQTVGPLRPGHRGIDLFGELPADLVAVRVNPVSPPRMGWNVPREAFGVAQAWVNGLRFEAELRAAPRPVAAEALRPYRHYLCYLTPDDAVLTMPGATGSRTPRWPAPRRTAGGGRSSACRSRCGRACAACSCRGRVAGEVAGAGGRWGGAEPPPARGRRWRWGWVLNRTTR